MPTRVGDLPLDTNLNGDLTVKRGDKLDNPRGGVKQSFQFKVSEGFEVLSAKVKRLADQTATQLAPAFQKTLNCSLERVSQLFSHSTLNLPLMFLKTI